MSDPGAIEPTSPAALTATAAEAPAGWASAWPDALAFLGGLALAWYGGWQTKDLVWSLWLSSLLVGYAMIVWYIFDPARRVWAEATATQAPLAAKSAIGGLFFVGGLFLLAFFTVHFGGFHFVHSVFLNAFFPVTDTTSPGFPGPAIYLKVFHDYWPFVLMAAVAERHAFRRPPALTPAEATAVTTEAIARRKAGKLGGADMMAPYRNVIRLHVLIFFFAFASFVKLENFLVYGVVYAAYFFPWRLLKREKSAV